MEQVFYFSCYLAWTFGPLFFPLSEAGSSQFYTNNKTVSLIILAIISLLLNPFSGCIRGGDFQRISDAGIYSVTQKQVVSTRYDIVIFGLMHGLNPEVKEYGF